MKLKMKFLQILVLIFGLTVSANSQIVNKSILSGTIYDANVSVIVKAKVTAISQKREKVETVTNDEGIYVLNLAFNQNSSSAKYDIIVETAGFKKSVTKDFVFIPSQFGKMQLDIALDAEISEPCGYGGDLCLESQILENTKQEIQNTILQRPLEKLPKGKSKVKKIFGKVLEPDEAGIPKAKITVFAKQIRFIETITDLNGNYELFLPVGQYSLEVKADGFTKAVVKNLNILDNKNFNLDLRLEISSITEHPLITENKKLNL